MKRIFIGMIVVLMVLALSYQVWALDDNLTVYSYEVINTLGYPAGKVIPTTSIRPTTDKVIGYEVMVYDLTKSAETFAALYDDTLLVLSGERLGEKEASTAGESCGEHWARGKKIFNGVTVWQGANTALTVYFVRK